MTTEQRKEELRKQFFEFTTLVSGVTIHSEASANQIFNFFYSEIEARDKRAELYEYEVEALKRVVREYEAERRRLEEIIKELKSKLPSGI